MAEPDAIPFAKVNEAIGLLLEFYKQQLTPDGQLKEDGELKKEIERLKADPEVQAKLEALGGKKRGQRRQRKMLEKLDKKVNIRKFSWFVAMMLKCQFEGQDDDDDDDDDDEA